MPTRILRLLCLVIWAGLATPALAEGKLAFVVGINAYSNLGAEAQLQRAVADATAVGEALRALDYEVTLLTEDAKLETIVSRFEAFTAKIRPGDTIVFYYAGHGVSLDDGNYLIPADIPMLGPNDERLAKRLAIPEHDFSQDIAKTGARVAVMVIDACRNNPFPQKGTRALGASTRGFSRMEQADGMFTLYSAREGQAAIDRLSGGDADANSVFTRVFLKELKTPGVNLSELGDRVRDEVAALARANGQDQVPAVYNDLLGSRTVFLAGPGATAPAPEAVAPAPVAPAPQRPAASASQPAAPAQSAALTPVAPAPAPQRPRCGGNADEAVMTPVLNVFQALRTKDIDLYARQWSDDAFYQDERTRVPIARDQIIAKKRQAFLRWSSVDARITGPTILSKTDSEAVLEDEYVLTIQSGQRVLRDSARERYVVHCEANDHWQIKQNLDYMQ
jgi:hypothetical protein